jgi:Uma2 family endonuclease
MPTVTDHAGLSWQELCEDPRFAFLDDLPFKVETNRWGQIVMSPTRFQHGQFQFEIGHRLKQALGGVVVTECAVQTEDGVKVADVGWFTTERAAEVRDAFAVPVAPQIAVEVLSPYNTPGELEAKRALYLAAGAEEVWVCDLKGRVRFFDHDGEREHSARAPDFPRRIGS